MRAQIPTMAPSTRRLVHPFSSAAMSKAFVNAVAFAVEAATLASTQPLVLLWQKKPFREQLSTSPEPRDVRQLVSLHPAPWAMLSLQPASHQTPQLHSHHRLARGRPPECRRSTSAWRSRTASSRGPRRVSLQPEPNPTKLHPLAHAQQRGYPSWISAPKTWPLASEKKASNPQQQGPGQHLPESQQTRRLVRPALCPPSRHALPLECPLLIAFFSPSRFRPLNGFPMSDATPEDRQTYHFRRALPNALSCGDR